MDLTKQFRHIPRFDQLEGRETPAAGVTISPLSVVTTEQLASATVKVHLNARPISDVTVKLSRPPASEGKLSKTSLKFTRDNWNKDQSFTVTGVNDLIADKNVKYQIVTSLSTSDPVYKTINPPDISVTNRSGDLKLVRSTVPVLTTSEAGDKSTLQVALLSKPLKDVKVTVSLVDTTAPFAKTDEAKFSIVTRGTNNFFTITPSDWSQLRTIVLTGLDDAKTDGTVKYDVRLSLRSLDPLFNNRILSIPAQNTDNESAGFTNGNYTGSFQGAVAIPNLGSRNVDGQMAFSIKDGKITVTKPGPGTGTVSSTGAVSGVIRPTAATLNGLNLPAGVTLSDVTVSFTKTGVSIGTWTLTGKVTVPFVGLLDITSVGNCTWTVTKSA